MAGITMFLNSGTTIGKEPIRAASVCSPAFSAASLLTSIAVQPSERERTMTTHDGGLLPRTARPPTSPFSHDSDATILPSIHAPGGVEEEAVNALHAGSYGTHDEIQGLDTQGSNAVLGRN
jgi:hypothetical protein